MFIVCDMGDVYCRAKEHPDVINRRSVGRPRETYISTVEAGHDKKMDAAGQENEFIQPCKSSQDSCSLSSKQVCWIMMSITSRQQLRCVSHITNASDTKIPIRITHMSICLFVLIMYPNIH